MGKSTRWIIFALVVAGLAIAGLASTPYPQLRRFLSARGFSTSGEVPSSDGSFAWGQVAHRTPEFELVLEGVKLKPLSPWAWLWRREISLASATASSGRLVLNQNPLREPLALGAMKGGGLLISKLKIESLRLENLSIEIPSLGIHWEPKAFDVRGLQVGDTGGALEELTFAGRSLELGAKNWEWNRNALAMPEPGTGRMIGLPDGLDSFQWRIECAEGRLTAFGVSAFGGGLKADLNGDGAWEFTFNEVDFARLLPNTIPLQKVTAKVKVTGSPLARKVSAEGTLALGGVKFRFDPSLARANTVTATGFGPDNRRFFLTVLTQRIMPRMQGHPVPYLLLETEQFTETEDVIALLISGQRFSQLPEETRARILAQRGIFVRVMHRPPLPSAAPAAAPNPAPNLAQTPAAAPNPAPTPAPTAAQTPTSTPAPTTASGAQPTTPTPQTAPGGPSKVNLAE